MPDVREWLQLAYLVVAVLLTVGMWMARRESAEREAKSLIAAAEKGARLATEHARELAERDLQRILGRVAELSAALDKSDHMHSEEYKRLHAKANAAQATINEMLQSMAERYVLRAEFDRLYRDLDALSARFDKHIDANLK